MIAETGSTSILKLQLSPLPTLLLLKTSGHHHRWDALPIPA
jgi:hypothetical protein